jgi:hypothetical protein
VILARAGLALTALAACSATATVLARGRRVTPVTLDLALALSVAAVAATWGAALPWARALGAAVALGAAAALPGLPLRARESRLERGPADPARGWKGFSRAMGNFQSRLLLGAIFFVLLAPFALAARFRDDPLAAPRGPSRWRPRAPAPATLADARRQG